MNKKSLCGLFLVFAGLLVALPAFAQSKTLIQGKWRLDGQTPKTNGGSSVAWFLK